VTRIGLLSDTHGYLDDRVGGYFKDCQQIWHAGDIGNPKISDHLASLKEYKAVYGNIDGTEIRTMHPLYVYFRCEEVNVLMIHIGGYPGHYSPEAKKLLVQNKTDLFISGHSHILKVMRDQELNLLHINPGAAGKQGMHKMRTIVRFAINGKRIEDLEVIELGARGAALP
jgi:putative phosphoesterase